ncbi:hypothetical protein [Siminovitchia fordii]|uniref:hypothetical protein n=1 Tax=Siminovitchia fordii TaxID=254759 RepID=UPI00201822B3|nr:hypothetical protein [Siminovitchia fordii]
MLKLLLKNADMMLSMDYQINGSICESELPKGKYVIFKIKHTKDTQQWVSA